VFCTRLGVGKFSTLQGSHVTSQSKLLAVQPLQILLPLHDLAGDLALGLCVAHHALLQVGHVLQLVVLQHAIHTHRSRFTCNCHFLRARLSLSRRRRAAGQYLTRPPFRRSAPKGRQAGSSRRRARDRAPRKHTGTFAARFMDLADPTFGSGSRAALDRKMFTQPRDCVSWQFFFSPAASSISHWAGLVASRANQ
jgi:hypothetical protein